jgi:hypothetical protein
MSYNLPTIGMDFSEFAIDFPQVVKGETNGNKQYNIDDTVNNLAGTWAYTFVDNKLYAEAELKIFLISDN